MSDEQWLKYIQSERARALALALSVTHHRWVENQLNRARAISLRSMCQGSSIIRIRQSGTEMMEALNAMHTLTTPSTAQHQHEPLSK